jgi:AcrR family transcriptional regulator
MPESAAADEPPPYDGPPRVGRPRDPRVDAAIHRATLDLLVDQGYQGTTIQAIARRAGVSAPSVYRRWSSKAELIEEAVFPGGLLAPEALSGDVITDLQPYCEQILTYLAEPPIRSAIPGLLVEYQNDPQMWQRVIDRSVLPMRESFHAFVDQTGRSPVLDVDALFDVMLGALFTRALNNGAHEARDFARAVAQVVTAALAPPRTKKAG